MGLYTLYAHPTHEPDAKKREKMMFNNPFQALVLEGSSSASIKEAELASVVILSSN